MRRDVALDEDRRALGIEPGREQHRPEVERRLVQLLGSNGVVIECRSTMQKNASPCSCVAAYWRKPPL